MNRTVVGKADKVKQVERLEAGLALACSINRTDFYITQYFGCGQHTVLSFHLQDLRRPGHLTDDAFFPAVLVFCFISVSVLRA